MYSSVLLDLTPQCLHISVYKKCTKINPLQYWKVRTYLSLVTCMIILWVISKISGNFWLSTSVDTCDNCMGIFFISVHVLFSPACWYCRGKDHEEPALWSQARHGCRLHHEGHQTGEDQRPSGTGGKILDYWGPSKKLVGDMNFLNLLKTYDRDNIAVSVYISNWKVWNIKWCNPQNGLKLVFGFWKYR